MLSAINLALAALFFTQSTYAGRTSTTTKTGAGSTSKLTTHYVTENCYTQYGTTSLKRPLPRTTTAITAHSHATITSIVTSSTVSTPSATTTTTTSTSTTVSTSTLPSDTTVVTTTSTITATDTESTTTTATVSTTEFVTVTSPLGPTSTVATPAGFTPIQSRYPSANIVGAAHNIATPRVNAREVNPLATQFATQVICSKSVLDVTLTIYTSTTSTIVTAPQPTNTDTATTTATSIVYYTPATISSTETTSTTSTTTSTSTITQTSTQTTTSTSSSYTPAPTVYAICEDGANFISSFDGSPIDSLGYDYSYSATTDFNNAVDCCNACQATNSCGSSSYLSMYRSCYFLNYNNVCDPNSPDSFFMYGGGHNLTTLLIKSPEIPSISLTKPWFPFG